jgi:DNA-binding winged helix-turn-helix (wHTH) protein
MPGASLKFDDLELDLGSYQLRRNGSVIKLEKIPMELLILLASRNGQLVSREEIVEKLWGQDVFVDSAHGVNTAIRKIRNALQDDPEKPRFIETVVGKGYRFVAPLAAEPEVALPAISADLRYPSKRFLLIGACVIAAIAVGAYLGLRHFWPPGTLPGGRTMIAVFHLRI